MRESIRYFDGKARANPPMRSTRVSAGCVRIVSRLLSVTWMAMLPLIATMNAQGAERGVAPEFPRSDVADWINSQPQSMTSLRGKPVLIEFWTFDCVNCRRTLPWIKAVQERYSQDGLAIVSIHTPEFAHEKDAANVRQAVKRLGITYPVMLDNDFAYWKAVGNRYWPAFYLVDRRGRIVATQIGELHEGQARADEFERQIKEALAKP